MAKKNYKVTVDSKWCKKCGICIEFCPQKVFDSDNGLPNPVRQEVCTGCRLCELRCPDYAVKVEGEEND